MKVINVARKYIPLSGGVTQAGLRSPAATGHNGEQQRFTGIADRPARPLNQETHDRKNPQHTGIRDGGPLITQGMPHGVANRVPVDVATI